MFVQSLDAAIEVFQPYPLAIYSYNTFICISQTFTNFQMCMNRRTLTVQVCAKQYKLGEAFRKLLEHAPCLYSVWKLIYKPLNLTN